MDGFGKAGIMTKVDRIDGMWGNGRMNGANNYKHGLGCESWDCELRGSLEIKESNPISFYR